MSQGDYHWQHEPWLVRCPKKVIGSVTAKSDDALDYSDRWAGRRNHSMRPETRSSACAGRC
jgi:hypothetical protein